MYFYGQQPTLLHRQCSEIHQHTAITNTLASIIPYTYIFHTMANANNTISASQLGQQNIGLEDF
jgi:hypothetical protein